MYDLTWGGGESGLQIPYSEEWKKLWVNGSE